MISTSVLKRLLAVLACLLFALFSAWPALVVYTRVDGVLFPGSELSFRIPGNVGGVEIIPDDIVETLPGVEGQQFQFSDPANRINILVLGLDTRPEDATGESAQLTESKLTDTMFVVSVDPASKTSSIISFPRDLYVEIPFSETRILEDRINVAYECGVGPPSCREPYVDGGPGLAMATVEWNFDINIDHYVIIDWEGFKDLINTLGGVDIDVPEELGPPPAGNDVFDAFDDKIVPGGLQHMNGDQALGYSRYRNGPDGDFGRIRRQQQMMFAVLDKAVGLQILNPARLQDLWGQYRRTVITDIRDVQVPGLSLLAPDIGNDDIFTFAITQDDIRETLTRQGAEVLLPIHENVNLVIAEALADPQVRREGSRILVRNASGDPVLGARVYEYLVDQGVPIGQLFLEETAGVEVSASSTLTAIQQFRPAEYTLERLLNLLGLNETTVQQLAEAEAPRVEGGRAQLVIVVGEDFPIDAIQ
ncbi:MAG: hypothetical protein GEU28_05515 [Dehalococcoidia bacterium]|nr:hypothetical protein [Dehalococcoidia bacterium]